MIGRTLCLLLVFLAIPLGIEAQPGGKAYRIGMLETIPASLNAGNLEAFRQALKELGYVVGQNLTIEYRSADGGAERFAGLATELVRLQVDLIVTRGTPAALAAKEATRTIPIVMAASGDPLGSGIVASLARPGGNITGLSSIVADLGPKRLEQLKEALQTVSRLGVVANMSNPAIETEWRQIQAASRVLGIDAELLDIRVQADIESAFEKARRRRADALIVTLDTLIQANRERIVTLSAKHRLPAIYASREFVEVGGLLAYGVSYPHLYRRAALFIDRIFKGMKPSELPVEQPTTLELVINLKTAKTLGLTIPHSVLLRADQVIQ
jgi:putative ABC transport system substrate-binding protein